jgi:ribosomal protein L21E
LLQELTLKEDSHPNYKLTSGIIRYKNRIVIGASTDLQEKIFQTFHSSALGGHSGNRVTLHRIKQIFFWPHMKQFIADKVAHCPVCQISKTERVHYPGLLDPLNIPKLKWSEISMDFIEGLPTSKGKNVIPVVVDRLTKYAHFLTVAHPFTAQTVANLFLDNIVKLHGPPQVIVSDRDRIFTSKLWQEMLSAYKVDLHYSTAYHPESDGQTERVNQCLEQYLRCMAFKEPKKWAEWLPAAEWWYNSSYHTSLKSTPFEALYGYAPPPIHGISIPCDVTPEVEVTLQEKDRIMKSLQQNLLQAQNRMKKYADLKRTERTFEIGDMVYLKMQPYRETALGLRNSLKLSSKYYGPYRVLQKVGKQAYKLQLPEGTLIHDVFHVNQLKKHIGPKAVPNSTLPLVTPDGKIKVAPLAVLQYRQVRRSAGDYDIPIPQWLIHWENMSPEEATWEDAKFIQATFPTFQP